MYINDVIATPLKPRDLSKRESEDGGELLELLEAFLLSGACPNPYLYLSAACVGHRRLPHTAQGKFPAAAVQEAAGECEAPPTLMLRDSAPVHQPPNGST